MESTMNMTPTHTPSSAGDGDNAHGNGVYTDELTKLSPESLHSSEKNDGVDFSHEQGSESNGAIDTENGPRSVDDNQSSETEDVVKAKDSKTEPDSLDDDVEIVIKNQHKYYIYCPCCGEDITKTVKLVKKSDLKPTDKYDTKNEVNGTENVSRSKDKKKMITFPSWSPVYLQQLFHSVYDGPTKDKGEKGVDTKSPGSYIDLGIDSEEPNFDFKIEKDRERFPKWYRDVFAWLFLCVIIALSVFSSPPQQPPPFIPLHLEMPSISSVGLPSSSILLLIPTFAVLALVIMVVKSHYSPRHHEEKGDNMVDSKSSDTTSVEQSLKPQNQDGQTADPGQDSEKKTGNQKIHPTPVDPSPHEQPSEKNVNQEAREYPEIDTTTQNKAEPGLQQKPKADIPKSVEHLKDVNKLEILKSIVYGGLTESITSLCTVTSAASSGASTLNVLALGVANLSSGVLLIVHNLRELINEKPRTRTNTDDQKKSETDVEDRYEEILGKRERSKLHSVIAISSFVICGLIPPLIYGFSFRKRVEKKQEYKTLAVYGASLTCIVLLSIAKAYVAKKREYLKTLIRYTAMAATASGFAQFIGYFVSQVLEKNGFYEDYPVALQV